jgi:tryptophanyl-tRNA synthetase
LPHLELSREIVRRFNKLYGPVLVEPKALLSESPNIPGSDGRKMSKSLGNEIGVRFEPDEIEKKVRSFVTDPEKQRKGDPGRPEVCPIFALHERFSGDILEDTDTKCRSGELGCVECKGNLTDRIVTYFQPFRERRAGLEATPGVVERVLEDGASKARPVIADTAEAVRRAMNLA